MDLLSVAQKFLAGKAWSSEVVLRMGVDLLSAAQLLPSIPFHEKTSLVCQTILRMLDGVEKVGKEHSLESIGIMPTTAQLEQYKNLVKMLPVVLELVNTGLPRVPLSASCVVPQGCLPLSWGCVRKEVAETVTAVEGVLKHPQHYLEEMRGLQPRPWGCKGLVSKVETLLSSKALPAPEPVTVVAEPESALEPVTVVAEHESAPEPVTVVAEPVPEQPSVPASVPEHVTMTVSAVAPEQTPEPVVSAFAMAAEPLVEPRSHVPPSPLSPDEQLPGGLANHEEVELSQK
jgi:hypothetical protein